ncbi:MAG: signal peptidase I [Patescibacteria group bacterium]
MKYIRSLLQLGSIALLILAGVVALSGRTNLFGGYHLYSVLTGSMEPTLAVSSLLVVRNQATPFGVDDIITFEQPGERGQLITHRVVAAEQVENSHIYHTKGDANPVGDSWLVLPSDIKGRVVYQLPYLGRVITLLNSPLGIILLVILPILLLAYQDIFTIHRALFDWQAERKGTKEHHA